MPNIPGMQTQQAQSAPMQPTVQTVDINQLALQIKQKELEEDAKAFATMQQMVGLFASQQHAELVKQIPEYLVNKIRWQDFLKDDQAKNHIGNIYRTLMSAQSNNASAQTKHDEMPDLT